MGHNNLVFLENLEWFDDTGKELVHRLPEQGSGEIKWGAQLTVRDSQVGVFFYQGKAVEAFGPGRHTLKTGNIPILTKIASLPWALNSPLRAEMYFVNMKVFANLKWGTRDPVAFKDNELGLIRLRAFGVFNLQVVQPVLFINRLVGTQGIFTTTEVEEYLNRVIVSRFNDFMGETIDSILNLPARYDELAAGLSGRLQKDFARFGLGLNHLYLNSITPPPEVQQAIDDKSRLHVFDDMNKLMQMKAAMAMEQAAKGETSGAGMGAGMGLMMPAMLAQYFTGAAAGGTVTPSGGTATAAGGTAAPATTSPAPAGEMPLVLCQECHQPIPRDARFCPACGHQQLVFNQCANCGKNLTPGARFCPRCGHPVADKPRPIVCGHCGAENLCDARFCNRCGEQL
ncbi:MAG: SPFH domain-containing protein [Deltaproteobacteria bacterium]|nr:SPFH domain-containing protein [Candidatus Anaeroferrophillacea bacterium]